MGRMARQLARTAVRTAKQAAFHLYYPVVHPGVGRYLAAARMIDGWTSHAELLALAETVKTLPRDPVIVELGSWLGRSALALAGACRVRGDGEVHCVDSFDARGDAFSAPTYLSHMAELPDTLRGCFDAAMEKAGLGSIVTVHEGATAEIGRAWSRPIDLLFIDADQSEAGARANFEAWAHHVKPGGLIAVHNSADRVYEGDHGGQRRLVVDHLKPPAFTVERMVWTTTFARRTEGPLG